MLERKGKNQDSTRCLLCQDLLIAPADLFFVSVTDGYHGNYWSQLPLCHVDLKTLDTRDKKKQGGDSGIKEQREGGAFLKGPGWHYGCLRETECRQSHGKASMSCPQDLWSLSLRGTWVAPNTGAQGQSLDKTAASVSSWLWLSSLQPEELFTHHRNCPPAFPGQHECCQEITESFKMKYQTEMSTLDWGYDRGSRQYLRTVYLIARNRDNFGWTNAVIPFLDDFVVLIPLTHR